MQKTNKIGILSKLWILSTYNPCRNMDEYKIGIFSEV